MKRASIVAVCSGKGGVGKSTVSFCLAKLLTDYNYKVGLVDADICGPSLHLLFNDLGNSKPEVCDNYIKPAFVNDIFFMSAAFYFPGGAFIRAPKANAFVKSFFENVRWPELDLIIVDFPPGTADTALTLFQEVAFDGAFIVTTPHALSVEDAAKSCKMVQDACVPILAIVENMAYFEDEGVKKYLFGRGGGAELASLFDLESTISLPLINQQDHDVAICLKQKLEVLKKIIDKRVLNKNLCTR